MLEATFSPLIPTESSLDFYNEFYNQYCFIQINDIFLSFIKDNLTQDGKSSLVETLNNFNEDQRTAAVYSIGAMTMNPSLMRRVQENRGISVELFKSLSSDNIDPLEWYQKTIEFSMLYATCEQALREYLVSNEVESTSIKEDNILNLLFKKLTDLSLRDKFLTELSNATSNIIKSENELKSTWKYFTVFRHDLAHAGGRSTNRIKDKMNDVIEKNKKEFDNVNSAMFLELPDEYEFFFTNPFESLFVTISDIHLNFFRNMTIIIIESLERTHNPKPYEIDNFDPYKLPN
ncbi:hypothetical protein PBV87_07865 [Niameybacter massiliensis]|uniref:Uncharacterized protein n=1 Tax=Holtiella tumoricola TaxID=3018743 RepID=A0AA42DLX4_9FIRM|nr:hypothetical protein [Holtiella tumoricola]MDA3731391.1 hypothetical protein [Holtiella tumoricola]